MAWFGKENRMQYILIIDDDVHIGNMLEEVLQKEDFGVLRAYSGTEALMVLDRRTPDLILLDLMLPGLNGEELLPKIHKIPVIVVSAKAESQSKVNLLLGGAADYVTKPFNLQELLARIRVQLRKIDNPIEEVLRFENIELRADSHAAAVNGIPVHLTRTEYAILKLLMRNPGQVLPKSLLLERIGEDTPDCTESSLKMHVSNLRKKLREAGGRDYIEAVWGIGFRIKA